MSLEIAGPLSGSDGIACKIGISCIGRSQSMIAGTPIVRQQNYTTFSIYCRLRIADARGSCAGEKVNPFVLGQCTPAIVGCIATVGDNHRTPVALQGIVGLAVIIIIS